MSQDKVTQIKPMAVVQPVPRLPKPTEFPWGSLLRISHNDFKLCINNDMNGLIVCEPGIVTLRLVSGTYHLQTLLRSYFIDFDEDTTPINCIVHDSSIVQVIIAVGFIGV